MSKIVDQVKADLDKREAKGLRSYGTTMDREDLTPAQWMNHLYEELLDAALYTKKLILNDISNEVTGETKGNEPGATESVDSKGAEES